MLPQTTLNVLSKRFLNRNKCEIAQQIVQIRQCDCTHVNLILKLNVDKVNTYLSGQ